MGIESHWNLGGPFWGDVLVGNERETPEFGTLLFAPTFKESGAVFGKNCDGSLVKDYCAVVVAEFTDTHEVVLKRRHDFGIAVREVELDIGLSRGAMLLARSITYRDSGRRDV